MAFFEQGTEEAVKEEQEEDNAATYDRDSGWDWKLTLGIDVRHGVCTVPRTLFILLLHSGR